MKMSKMISRIAGINGFGRFSLHLLKYWFDRIDEAKFIIQYINDDSLTKEDIYSIITTDRYVKFPKSVFKLRGDNLILELDSKRKLTIVFTHKPSRDIPWLGKPDIFFECSGKHTKAKTCLPFLVGLTKKVIISATSWDADKTLIYGYNHSKFGKADRIISYGSCTVDAYVPIAAYIEKHYGILESDVNVIHNQPEYKLNNRSKKTLVRKFCTLQRSGPKLLGFINVNNFHVNYTLIPYSGVSIIDLRFKLRKDVAPRQFISIFRNEIKSGVLKGIYGLDPTDGGTEAYANTAFSTVFIEEKIKIIGNNLYLFGYFDNENSATRYFDLIQYLSDKI